MSTSPTRILRCPRCGATDVRCDEDRSIVDISCMCCQGCGYEAFIDSWERDFDWVATVMLDDNGTTLPTHVAPLAPGLGLHDAPLSTAPPAADAPRYTGCASCRNDDAAVAYSSSQTRERQSVVEESHLGVHLSACSCGQRFVTIFTERIDWRDGNDDQTWLIAAVDDDEAAALAGAGAACGAVVAGLKARRFMCRSWRDGGIAVWWLEGTISIGRHD